MSLDFSDLSRFIIQVSGLVRLSLLKLRFKHLSLRYASAKLGVSPIKQNEVTKAKMLEFLRD